MVDIEASKLYTQQSSILFHEVMLTDKCPFRPAVNSPFGKRGFQAGYAGLRTARDASHPTITAVRDGRMSTQGITEQLLIRRPRYGDSRGMRVNRLVDHFSARLLTSSTRGKFDPPIGLLILAIKSY